MAAAGFARAEQALGEGQVRWREALDLLWGHARHLGGWSQTQHEALRLLDRARAQKAGAAPVAVNPAMVASTLKALEQKQAREGTKAEERHAALPGTQRLKRPFRRKGKGGLPTKPRDAKVQVVPPAAVK